MTDTLDTNTQDGDFLTVLSSELIAEVMEEYFNRKMYRQKVKVVDLQPQGSGYAFSLAFVKDTSVKNMEFTPEWLAQSAPEAKSVLTNGQPKIDHAFVQQFEDAVSSTPHSRDTKGKFTKKVQ